MALASPQLGSQHHIVESDLITRAQQGDRWAFGELVRQHRQGVMNIVYRMCGDVNLAEDTAQETFLRAWQHLDKYKPKGAFRNWIYKIALNTARNILRSEKTTMDIDDYKVVDRKPNPEQTVEQTERARLVQHAVLALPDASRSVLVLREYEGLSYRDIAETLDIPVGTVMSRLSYARQLLRKSLAGLLEVA
jgi:RNA polymerase sigma-70 factor (ECF subfamily)